MSVVKFIYQVETPDEMAKLETSMAVFNRNYLLGAEGMVYVSTIVGGQGVNLRPQNRDIDDVSPIGPKPTGVLRKASSESVMLDIDGIRFYVEYKVKKSP
jgi:hypothetical protein